MVETMKKAPENNPNPANRKAPLSPNLNARKPMEKLRQEQIPDTMMTTPFHMTLSLLGSKASNVPVSHARSASAGVAGYAFRRYDLWFSHYAVLFFSARVFSQGSSLPKD